MTLIKLLAHQFVGFMNGKGTVFGCFLILPNFVNSVYTEIDRRTYTVRYGNTV